MLRATKGETSLFDNDIVRRYDWPVIKSFADSETEKVYCGGLSRKFLPDIQKTARRKLLYLDEADTALWGSGW
jgi:hypothetical protein